MKHLTRRTDVLEVRVGHELDSLEVDLIFTENQSVLAQSHPAQEFHEIGGVPNRRSCTLPMPASLSQALTLMCGNTWPTKQGTHDAAVKAASGAFI